MKRGLFIALFLIVILFISGQQSCEPTVSIGTKNTCCKLVQYGILNGVSTNCISDISQINCDELFSHYSLYFSSEIYQTNLQNSCADICNGVNEDLSCTYKENIYKNEEKVCLEEAKKIYQCQNGEWTVSRECTTKGCSNTETCSFSLYLTKTLCSTGGCGGTPCSIQCSYATSCSETGTDSSGCGYPPAACDRDTDGNSCTADILTGTCVDGYCSINSELVGANLIGGINSLVVFNNQLYAGSSNGKVYHYDSGTTWSDIGTLYTYLPYFYTVRLIPYNNQLYAGVSGGILPYGKVYRYDSGTTWTTVGTFNDYGIFSLVVYNNKLYVGTYPEPADATQTGKVYRYDSGTTWTEIGSLTGAVSALESYNGKLYAGVQCSVCGDATNVYSYDGSSWVAEGNLKDTYFGVTAFINSFIIYNNKLYAGAGGNIYSYTNTNDWASAGRLETTSSGNVRSFEIYNNKIYTITANPGGKGYLYGGGTTWNKIGEIQGKYTMSLRTYNNKLYVGASDITKSIGEIYTLS